MQLFSSLQDPHSHRVRIVLAAKEIACRITFTDEPQHMADMMLLNPEGTTPTFHDRGMTLTEPRIIMEYLDDRFPHPPLMPVDPIEKARARVLLLDMETRLYGQLAGLKSQGSRKRAAANASVQGYLKETAAMLREQSEVKYICGDGITILDASLLPVLWRLEMYHITPSRNDLEVYSHYARRIYPEKLFQKSLTEAERGLYLNK